MTALLTSYLNSAQATGLATVLLWASKAEELRERERDKDIKWQSRRKTETDEQRETKKWEIWRVAFRELKSDSLVQRVLWPRCWQGNGFAQLILCVRHSENVFVCIYPYAYASWFHPSACLWHWNHANQCCLGLTVRDSHLDAALIISVVIFTE